MELNQTGHIIIIASLLFIIFVLAGLLILLMVRQMKVDKAENGQVKTTSSPHSQTTTRSEGMCHFHPNEAARSQCAICCILLCETCNRDYEQLHFCPAHFELYTCHRWLPLSTVVTKPQSPQNGLALYQFKESLWEGRQIPSYVVTHYKIDVETDQIESYIQLYVREEEFAMLSSLYQNTQEDKGSVSQ